MHYYITKAESGHQACLEADYHNSAGADADIIGAISESGAEYINDGTVGDLTSIEDAEFYVRQCMHVTADYKKWREKIRHNVMLWLSEVSVIEDHEIEDIIYFFQNLWNRKFYTSMTIGRGIETFKDGLKFASDNYVLHGATNMYQAFDWHKGEMWVVFIQNEI